MATAINIAGRIEELLGTLQRQALRAGVGPAANLAAGSPAATSLAATSLAAILAEWPRALLPRPRAPCGLPVLRWLPRAARGCPPFAADLVEVLCRDAQSMEWRRTYRVEQLGSAFFDNYGWSEVLGTNGPWASERIACGFLLLGPATSYPRHRHEAEEIYVPLSGTASWQQGDAIWREHPPGTLIHHAGDEPHAMRTGDDPLLALYLWRSADLSQKARLDPA
jgi:Dimethlysulfonioproprionate lyase